MRILAVPAAILLACCFYLPLPALAARFADALRWLYRQTLRLFTRKSGAADHAPALYVFLLLLCGVSALLGALHPLAAALLMAPLFTGLAALPACVQAEHELDSGKYARDIPAYEALVRETCLSVAPAFVSGVAAPMLLCAAGMPLHLACPLGYVWAALCALEGKNPQAARAVLAVQRICERIFLFMITLCAGVTGRSPFSVRGKTVSERVLNIVGLSGDHAHAPMAGDIAQAIFLCAFSCGVLCFVLCAVGFVLC